MRQRNNSAIKLIFAILFLSFIIPSVIFAFCYKEAGREYNINPLLLYAISKTESDLNPSAVNTNSDGTIDIGLMQINSSWIKAINLNPDLLLSDPCYNVKTGADILKKCIDMHGYTWEAVGCYNAVSRNKRVKYSRKIFDRLTSEAEKIRNLEDEKKTVKKSRSASKTEGSQFFFSISD